MLELALRNAASYLGSRGFSGPLRISELGGGVSNTVLLVESDHSRFVLKQALGKLRVEQDWFSDRGRIFRESAGMRAVAPWLPPGSVPEVLFEDRDNLLFAMSAAAQDARTWKTQLLAGEVRTETAARIGRMLAAIVRRSWRSPEWERIFGDVAVFDQLRLDPYYRSTAQRHPDLRGHFDALIADCLERRVSLVHGDWSPKNFLVIGESVTAIDFEVIHFGNPAFDAAFLLNHLLLKSFYRPEWRTRFAAAAAEFWAGFAQGLPADADWVEEATVRQLGGLLLARIDGKSPAEYIREEGLRERVRRFARDLILQPPRTMQEIFACA